MVLENLSYMMTEREAHWRSCLWLCMPALRLNKNTWVPHSCLGTELALKSLRSSKLEEEKLRAKFLKILALVLPDCEFGQGSLTGLSQSDKTSVLHFFALFFPFLVPLCYWLLSKFWSVNLGMTILYFYVKIKSFLFSTRTEFPTRLKKKPKK